MAQNTSEQPTEAIRDERELAAIEERASKATPAQWEWHTSNSWRRLKRETTGENVAEPYVVHHDGQPDLTIEQRDMDFIAAARTDMPRLCAALREAWTMLDEKQGVIESLRSRLWNACDERDRALEKAAK